MPRHQRHQKLRPSESARKDIQALFGDEHAGGTLAPDRLLEYLHRIQDNYHQLSKDHLLALADILNLAPVKVHEVASFYHHFDIVENDHSAPEVVVRVCDSISCEIAGSEALIQALEAAHTDKIAVRIDRVPCVGRCAQAPVAVVGQNAIAPASEAAVDKAISQRQLQAPSLTLSLDTYLEADGYRTLAACLNGEHSVDSIIETLGDAGLRGLGGAGFPLAKKWEILRSQSSPRIIAVNIDEGEPGTFKDRHYLESDPHALLEGALIAAWAIDASKIVLYVRDEYPALLEALQTAINDLHEWADFPLAEFDLRRGAGAYICGEESAMIESIEGKRPYPRQRPPYIAEVGLYGLPTLEHNAETLYWVPCLLRKGAEYFTQHGRRGRVGLRSFSLSGRVRQPGVYLAPAGISVRELIDEFGGGMQEGHELYGYFPGGASGGILPASLGDEPLDFDTLQTHGCFIGSAAVIVFSQHDSARDLALNAMRFFAHESCGQCTPCRAGTQKAASLMQAEKWDIPLLESLASTMEDASICGLGQAAPNPLRTLVRYFPHEVRS